MKVATNAVLTALASLALAFPAPSGHEYQAPGSGDVRSPCPGLNSLANHGFINRNGKNITVPSLTTGGLAGLGMGPDFMVSIGELALFSPSKPNGVSFDLNDLAEHNFPIEHDVSLSRQDYYFSHDDITFYKPNYNEFIANFNGMSSTTLQTSANARAQRVKYSLTKNPQVTFGPMAFLFSYGESGLYTQTMGSSPTAAGAPVAYVKSLFEKERLPYELGWQPSTVPITLVSLGAFVLELFNAQGDARLPIGLEVLTKGTYRQFLTQYAAIAGKVKNVTQVDEHLSKVLN